MDAEQLRENAHKIVYFIADYYQSLGTFPILSQVKLLEELHAKQKQEIEVQEELEGLKESLQSERQNLKDIISYQDNLKSLCEEKDSALQAAIIDKKIVEAKLAKLTTQEHMPLESSTRKEILVGSGTQIGDALVMRIITIMMTKMTSRMVTWDRVKKDGQSQIIANQLRRNYD